MQNDGALQGAFGEGDAEVELEVTHTKALEVARRAPIVEALLTLCESESLHYGCDSLYRRRKECHRATSRALSEDEAKGKIMFEDSPYPLRLGICFTPPDCLGLILFFEVFFYLKRGLSTKPGSPRDLHKSACLSGFSEAHVLFSNSGLCSRRASKGPSAASLITPLLSQSKQVTHFT